MTLYLPLFFSVIWFASASEPLTETGRLEGAMGSETTTSETTVPFEVSTRRSGFRPGADDTSPAACWTTAQALCLAAAANAFSTALWRRVARITALVPALQHSGTLLDGL